MIFRPSFIHILKENISWKHSRQRRRIFWPQGQGPTEDCKDRHPSKAPHGKVEAKQAVEFSKTRVFEPTRQIIQIGIRTFVLFALTWSSQDSEVYRSLSRGHPRTHSGVTSTHRHNFASFPPPKATRAHITWDRVGCGGVEMMTFFCTCTHVQSAAQWTAPVHTLHMPKPVM